MRFVFHTHLVFEFPGNLEQLRRNHPNHQFIEAEHKDNFNDLLPGADAVVCGYLSEEQWDAAVNLRALFIPFTGISGYMDEQARLHNVTLYNNHGNAKSVAERAVALAMAAAGRVIEFHTDMQQGEWHRTGNPRKPFDYWISMAGKKAGFLGTGAIAGHISRFLSGFDMANMGFNTSGTSGTQFPYPCTTDLDEVLNHADFLFVALPSTEKTKGLLGASELSTLGHAFIINVSRGDIIQEQPFFDALANGTLAGAGIDAWYVYPEKGEKSRGSNLEFHNLKNVVMSPHAASHCIEGKQGQLSGTVEKINEYIQSLSLPQQS